MATRDRPDLRRKVSARIQEPMKTAEEINAMMRALRRHLPDGVGHAVFMLDWVYPGEVGYVSTAARPEMITVRRELLTELKALPAADNGPARPRDETFESQAFRLAMQTPFAGMIRVLKLHLPAGMDFAIVVFEYEASGGLAWMSSTDDMGRVTQGIRRWLTRQKEQRTA
jgi:hypothetical protein